MIVLLLTGGNTSGSGGADNGPSQGLDIWLSHKPIRKLSASLLSGRFSNTSRPATVTDKYLAIPAADFLKRHHLNIRGSPEVSEDHGSGYLLLSPVLKS